MRYTVASLLALTLLVASCRKDKDNGYYPAPEIEDTTVGSQDVYKVNTYKTTGKAEILLSPYMFSTADKGRVMIFNEKGKLVREKITEGATFCFRRWVVNGKIRYTYIVNDVATTHIPYVTQLTGYVVIADSTLNEIKRVHLMPYNDVVTGPGYVDLDVHDFILLSDDHYITMSYYPKHVNNIPATLNPHPNLTVIANVIQEIKNNEVIWHWDGTEYPEFYAGSVEGNNYADSVVPQDYMHMNSMIIDPRDNNLICSYRHLDQLLKIDRKTGGIVWRLGGKTSNFALSSSQYFMRQHDATLIDNNKTLLLFDNGDQAGRPRSRVLEFTMNEAGRTISAYKSFDIPAPFSQYMGSVQKMANGNYFIGGGTGNYALEINPNTGERYIEFIGDRASYRAYKYELGE